MDLDALVSQALIETGAPRAQVAFRDPRAARLVITSQRRGRSPSLAWTPEEDRFVREHYLHLTDTEIGRVLGRSEAGVHIRRERVLRLPARSKQADDLTANQIAEGLHVDIHSVMGLIDRGLLPGWILKHEQDTYRMVKRVTLLRFITNPLNWIYFKPDQVGAHPPRRTVAKYDAEFWQHARRLVQIARSRWADDWLTPAQVGARHGVTHMAVNNAIHEGKIRGVKWGNWHILRSEATKPGLYFAIGKGRGSPLTWTAAGDAFLLLARAVGFSVNAIQALMGYQYNQRVSYRLAELERLHLTRKTITRFDLPIAVSRSGHAGRDGLPGCDLFADWKRYRKRFKALAAAMDKFKRREPLAERDRQYVRGVFKTWALRFYRRSDRAALLGRLYTASNQSDQTLRAIYQQLQRAGVDPYKRVQA